MVRSIHVWIIVLISLLFLPILLAAETQYEITLVDSVIIPYSYEYVQVTQDSLLRFWDLEIETESITVNTFTLDRQGNLTTPAQVLSTPNEHGYETPLSFYSQFYESEDRICVGCNNDSFLTLHVFENDAYQYEREYQLEFQIDEFQRRAHTLLWDTNTFLIALDQAVIRCNLDENVADTLITFEDDWPIDIPTHLYPLGDQYLIISRNWDEWYLLNTYFDLIQEIDTYDQFEFEGNTFETAYPAIEISGGYVVSYINLAFTDLMAYFWVENNALHIGYGVGTEMDSYPHFANPVSLNDSIFFFTDLGGPFVVIGEYTDNDIGYYGGGIAISYGCTVAKMDSYLAILRQMDDLHRVRIYDDTFPEYHEEEFSVPAPSDPEYHPSRWYNYMMQPYVFFERRYRSTVGETSRIYIYHIDTYEPTSGQTIPKPELTLSCYPNPFNPTTTITFSIAEDAAVRLEIFNIRGQLVNTLVDEPMHRGEHSVLWQGDDDAGKPVSSGVYLYRVASGDLTRTQKMILMK